MWAIVSVTSPNQRIAKRVDMKRFHSFRLRLAFLSVLCAAFGLLAFGVFTGAMWYRDRLNRVDLELARLGHPLASRGHARLPWNEVFQAMSGVLGEEKIEARLFMVENQLGANLYKSANWPSELEGKAFPAGEKTLQWRGQFSEFLRPGQGPRPPGPPRFRRPPDLAGEGDIPPRGPNLEGRLIRRLESMRSRPQKEPTFYTVSVQDEKWRLGVFANEDVKLLIGANLNALAEEVATLRLAFASASLAALGLIALGAWMLSRRALRPIEALTETTRGITAHGLDKRVPLINTDVEFIPLMTVYNDMLNRLETSFHQALRFSADASHELKTPLAVMKGLLERGVAESEPGSREQERYGALLEEVEHQEGTLRSLLLLSQADAGELRLASEEVDLASLVRQAAEDAEIIADEDSLQFELTMPDTVPVKGDRSLLQQLLHNLFANAVKYNEPNGRVVCQIELTLKTVTVTISNTGPVIPEAEQGQVFERFFRAAAAREGEQEGVGLGLSLSREIARAHGGDLALVESREGKTTFILTLPKGDAQDSLE